MLPLDVREIRRNLGRLDELYNDSLVNPTAKNGDSDLYSKLAVLELCGWIEVTIDEILRSHATTGITSKDSSKYIEITIKKTHGFNYAENYRPLLLKTLGAYEVQVLESTMKPQSLIDIEAELVALTESRNTHAHTFLVPGRRPIDAPSLTIGRFKKVYRALTDLERSVRRITSKR